MLFNGLSESDALRTRNGLSENVLNVYAERVRNGDELLKEPLEDLFVVARQIPSGSESAVSASVSIPEPSENGPEDTDDEPQPKRMKIQTSPSSDLVSSPTRKSGRLQEIQEKTDIQEGMEDGTLAPDLEQALANYLRRLVTVNFPIPAELIIGLASELMRLREEAKNGISESMTNGHEGDESTSNPSSFSLPWVEKFRQKYNVTIAK